MCVCVFVVVCVDAWSYAFLGSIGNNFEIKRKLGYKFTSSEMFAVHLSTGTHGNTIHALNVNSTIYTQFLFGRIYSTHILHCICLILAWCRLRKQQRNSLELRSCQTRQTHKKMREQRLRLEFPKFRVVNVVYELGILYAFQNILLDSLWFIY